MKRLKEEEDHIESGLKKVKPLPYEKFSFLNEAFPFVSPYYQLTQKYDLVLELLFSSIALSRPEQESFTTFMNHLTSSVVYQRTAPCEESELVSSLIDATFAQSGDVLFCISATLSFLEADFNLEKIKKELNVSYYFYFVFIGFIKIDIFSATF